MSISGSCWNLATKVALRLGPRNPLVYAMLARRCQAHGAKFGVREGVVEVVKGNRVVRLAADHFAFAPDIAKSFDSYHGAVVPELQNDCLVVDYSRPRPQRYSRSGLVFEMCGAAEEEAAIEDYFRWHRPAPGEIVFDVGANCGVSAYHLSRCVGPTGRVYAFEPDPLTHDLLLKNLAAHGLDNVVPLRLALAGTSGTAAFQAEGTLGSTLARVASRDTLGDSDDGGDDRLGRGVRPLRDAGLHQARHRRRGDRGPGSLPVVPPRAPDPAGDRHQPLGPGEVDGPRRGGDPQGVRL